MRLSSAFERLDRVEWDDLCAISQDDRLWLYFIAACIEAYYASRDQAIT
jgi:hypothetical protein